MLKEQSTFTYSKLMMKANVKKYGRTLDPPATVAASMMIIHCEKVALSKWTTIACHIINT